MRETPIIVERLGAVELITLNRPKAGNEINQALSQSLCTAIDAAQSARCIVITGADPWFCGGLELDQSALARGWGPPPFYEAALDNSTVPKIAAVNGPATAGGLEIALCCDFIVASERAVFAAPHLREGVDAGLLLMRLQQRIGPAWAREMSMTGNFVDAATALRIGLANHLKPHEDLIPFALELARAIAENEPHLLN
jgi:enoyl-CoA hydratase